MNFEEKDPKKQTVSKRVTTTRGILFLPASPDGEHCVFDKMAYRVGKSGLEEIWTEASSAKCDYGHNWAWHPVDRRIWTGASVLEFSSGRELVKVRSRRGLNSPDSCVWVASDRVAEIAYADAAEGKSGRAVITLWDAKTGELAAKAEAASAESLCASPDGLHLAEAGLDKRVRIRSAQTLEVEQEFRCHESALTGVAWHPTLPLLVTQASDGVIRVWNLGKFEKVEEFINQPHKAEKTDEKRFFRLEITSDGRELNVYRRGVGVFVYNPESFQVATPIK
jgi:hypothetical protein